MIIPIPIGTKHVASVQGAVWKVVICARCQRRYAYLLELEATGEDLNLLFLDSQGCEERARLQAEQNLKQKCHNCVCPVPCPECGFYQDDMVKRLQEEAWTNPYQVAGALIALLSLLPLAFRFPFNWVATLIGAAVGLGMLAYGYVLTFRFDPNAGDPETRKALGRKHAVWGEELTLLLAATPSTAIVAAAARR